MTSAMHAKQHPQICFRHASHRLMYDFGLAMLDSRTGSLPCKPHPITSNAQLL